MEGLRARFRPPLVLLALTAAGGRGGTVPARLCGGALPVRPGACVYVRLLVDLLHSTQFEPGVSDFASADPIGSSLSPKGAEARPAVGQSHAEIARSILG